MTTTSIKNIDEKLFRLIKAEAAKEKEAVGSIVNRAFYEYISRHKSLGKKKMSEFKPFDGGKGTENTSQEVDEILYGNFD